MTNTNMNDTNDQNQAAEEILSDDSKISSASDDSTSAELSLEVQLQQALRERDDQTDRALRAQAELENVRKRLQRETQQLLQFALMPLISDLLPSLDNLNRAIEAAEQSGSVEELLKGIRMVSSSFAEVLDRHGAKRIPTSGETFDPNLHEALQQIPSPDHDAMQIIQEVESGWQLHDRVVRPSKVIVSSGPPTSEN
ncbi:MAG TPA: nucleotide exchange factor GrpE [Planctomycetaceae bacterium]|nr:nucleotide exchange factor GrpE [Planctomycetaceae bacterium]